uniref:Uncharacterized protein n=1 Tax=Triticum urartu TaxID=4572 RepID=A0A8R7Q7M6_TRIUA
MRCDAWTGAANANDHPLLSLLCSITHAHAHCHSCDLTAINTLSPLFSLSLTAPHKHRQRIGGVVAVGIAAGHGRSVRRRPGAEESSAPAAAAGAAAAAQAEAGAGDGGPHQPAPRLRSRPRRAHPPRERPPL